MPVQRLIGPVDGLCIERRTSRSTRWMDEWEPQVRCELCTWFGMESTSCQHVHPQAVGSRATLRGSVPGLLFDAVGELGDLVEDTASLRHELANLSIGVHDRRVVATTELLADLW